jgi:hypothetical protein
MTSAEHLFARRRHAITCRPSLFLALAALIVGVLLAGAPGGPGLFS